MTRRPRAFALAVAVVCAAACGKKSKTAASMAPEISGLAAVPATAEGVIGVDVAKLAGSPIVERAIDQLLMRDADLAARWQKLQSSCKLDVTKQIKHVMLAMGPHPGAQPGTGPVLVVATGAINEADLSACVRSLVGEGGGSLTAKPVEGRTLYVAKDGNREMFFAFGRADTVVLGSSEAYVTEALGTSKKALDNPELAKWIGLANQNAPVWAAGRVDERVRAGLLKVTSGELTSGPLAIVGSLDPTDGAKLEVGAVMKTADDAKKLESFAKTQLGVLGMVAQVKSLGPLIDKIAVSADGEVVRLRLPLTMADVNQLLSLLDGARPPTQDSPPSQEAGSNTGSAQH